LPVTVFSHSGVLDGTIYSTPTNHKINHVKCSVCGAQAISLVDLPYPECIGCYFNEGFCLLTSAGVGAQCDFVKKTLTTASKLCIMTVT
jgi:hypothetical protein